MIDQLQSQALAAWHEIHPHTPKPDRLDHLLQSRDYIIVFWFDPRGKSTEPVLISKVPRTENFNRYAERSIQLVEQLKADLKPPIRDTLPARIIAGQVNSLTHIVMGLMPGEPQIIPEDNNPGRPAAEQQVSAFLTWLIEFQSQAAKGSREFAWDEFINGYQDKSGLEFLRTEPYLEYSQKLIDRLPATSIPFTWGYGDAHHSNILMEGDRVSGVIDWIGVKEETWFFTDWYYFLFFYAFEFFKKNSQSGSDDLRRLALSTTMGVNDHWLSQLFRDKTVQYLEGCSFDPQVSPEILLAFLYDLHWPQDKAQLLKDAWSIYSSRYPR